MEATPRHVYQVLTKRPERMREFVRWRYAGRQVPAHIWYGISVENQHFADERIPLLLQTPAAVRFISAEPLLGPIDFTKWIGYYPCHEGKAGERARSISGSSARGIVDRRGWSHLASLETDVESLGCKPEIHGPDPSSPGRERRRAVSSGARDGKSPSVSRPSAPAGLHSLQGLDSARADSEPRERQEERQQAGESDACDIRGASKTRPGSTESRSARSERREERDGEAEPRRSAGDSSATTSRRTAPVDSGSIQRLGQDRLEDRARREMDISWLICGGESGPHGRLTNPDWVRSIRDQCVASGVAFFFKQWGGRSAKSGGRELDGRTWDDMPIKATMRSTVSGLGRPSDKEKPTQP